MYIVFIQVHTTLHEGDGHSFMAIFLAQYSTAYFPVSSQTRPEVPFLLGCDCQACDDISASYVVFGALT